MEDNGLAPLKYALIGCGRRGIQHLETAMEMRETLEVVGVCDANQTSMETFADRAGVPGYSNVAEMVEMEKPDICDVVVPSELHHAISLYLSIQGISHNVETPLAPTLGLMDLMIKTASDNNVKLQTSENFPFLPVEQFVCKLIREGVIGPVHKCHRLFSTLGYHGLAAIRCRMGAKPTAVSSLGHSMPVIPYVDGAGRDYDTEELEIYIVDFEGGGIAIAMVGNKNGCLGRNSVVGFETCGERGTIVTNGNQGAVGGETVNVCTDEDVKLRAGRGGSFPFQREYDGSGNLRRIWVDLPESLGGTVEWENPYHELQISENRISLATLLEGLAESVVDGKDPLWPGEFGLADQEMILAAKRSIGEERKPVELPLPLDSREERAFDTEFEEKFGVNPRPGSGADLDEIIKVNFKAR
jgi:predicted dehydrogenase